MGRRRTPLWDRFWGKADQSGGLDACWPWLGALSQKRRSKRPVIQEGGRGSRVLIAARVALALSTDGEWDKVDETGAPLEACHTCHNERCVNPRHLYWGTRQQNVVDWQENRRRQRGVAGGSGMKRGRREVTGEALAQWLGYVDGHEGGQ